MKTVRYTVDDLAIEPDGIADNLNQICNTRPHKLYLSGFCQYGETCLFLFEEDELLKDRHYMIKAILTGRETELKEEILSHWGSDIGTRAIINMGGDLYYAIYEKMSKN
jgi:hypothetical protein